MSIQNNTDTSGMQSKGNRYSQSIKFNAEKLRSHISDQLSEYYNDPQQFADARTGVAKHMIVSKQTNIWTSLIEQFGGLPGVKTSYGNRVGLLVGAECSERFYLAVKLAKKRIWVETYIFDSSAYAKLILDELISAKVNRHVDVVVVLDKFGSSSLPAEWLHSLRAAGISVSLFHSWSNVFIRDHRKLAIIDSTAFCGSNNISLGAAPSHLEGSNFFFDVSTQLEGPCVKDLADIFTTTHQIEHAIQCLLERPAEIPYSEGGGTLVQIAESDPLRKIKAIQLIYSRILPSAAHSIWAMTGYFDPPWWLKLSIKRAALKHTPIALSLSGNSDVIADTKATQYLICKYLARKWAQPSFRIWVSTDRHCHGKMVLVDNIWASVGSYNWDRLSSRRNLEVTVTIFDARFAKQAFRAQARLTKSFSQNQFIDPIKIEAENTRCLSSADKLEKSMRFPDEHDLFPQMEEMTREKCRALTFSQRCVNRFARLCVKLSASSAFDRFEEFEAQKHRAKILYKISKVNKVAESSFLHGPSTGSLDLFSKIYP